MMRTVEVLIVIIIIAGAFIISSFFAVLPWPRQVSPVNLRRLALTTMQTLDINYDLSSAAFEANNITAWGILQTQLSAVLPPNVLYNLTVYDVNAGEEGSGLYSTVRTISNAENLGITTDASSYLVASANVTFNVKPEKIGEHGGGTLYILNCSDANGWWITGYTAQSLAEDLQHLLSPYYVTTIMVQNTMQLRMLMDGQNITDALDEHVQNATVINPFGESVPMPSEYYYGNSRSSLGYDSGSSSYNRYCHTLGLTVRTHNWTWASIVGYPFYYVSNLESFSTQHNTWGIYGMSLTGPAGVRAFLQGLDGQGYFYDNAGLTDEVGVVTLTPEALEFTNYYGIYPSSYQTSTRALSNSILTTYHLSVGFNVFNPSGNYYPGCVYNHVDEGETDTSGTLLALGLTRTPDVRVTALSLLSYYHPRIYRSEYTAVGTSRLAVLQLGLVGGV
jgi:hypothetical protein